jgi:hypothetical protein
MSAGGWCWPAGFGFVLSTVRRPAPQAASSLVAQRVSPLSFCGPIWLGCENSVFHLEQYGQRQTDCRLRSPRENTSRLPVRRLQPRRKPHRNRWWAVRPCMRTGANRARVSSFSCGATHDAGLEITGAAIARKIPRRLPVLAGLFDSNSPNRPSPSEIDPRVLSWGLLAARGKPGVLVLAEWIWTRPETKTFFSWAAPIRLIVWLHPALPTTPRGC